MKKLLSATALAVLLSFGGNVDAKMAATPSTATTPSKVSDAAQMQDDMSVIVVGTITKSLGDGKYELTDSTGSIIIDADDEEWNGIDPNSGVTIMVVGEIDNDDGEPVEIDVEEITVMPKDM